MFKGIKGEGGSRAPGSANIFSLSRDTGPSRLKTTPTLRTMTNMSESKEVIEKKIENLLDKRSILEEKCDTLPECSPEACKDCDNYKKMEQIDEKIGNLEEKITPDDEEEEDE